MLEETNANWSSQAKNYIRFLNRNPKIQERKHLKLWNKTTSRNKTTANH